MPVFTYVGYIIGLYFIFRAISYVTHFSVFEAEDKKNGKKQLGEEAVEKNREAK